MPTRPTLQNRRRRKRRGRPGCLSALIFAVVFIAAALSAVLIFFKVNNVSVVGAEHYRPEQIRANVDVQHGDNLVFISKYSISRDVMAAMPYVESVTVTRVLPHTLLVTVEETHAAAYFELYGSIWLLSPGGKLLEHVSAIPKGLIEIVGAEPIMPSEGSIVSLGADSASKLKTLTDTLTALDVAGMTADVTRLDISGVYNVGINYLERFTVNLGAPEDLSYKLDFLKKITTEELPESERGTIDMSSLIETAEARFKSEK